MSGSKGNKSYLPQKNCTTCGKPFSWRKKWEKNWDEVKEATLKLGLNWENHIKCSTMQIYKHYNINENDFSILTFEKQIRKT